MNAHFIDLDILIKIESKPWIVDKSNPNRPIMKMNIEDFNLFESGIFKSHGNKIQFGSKTFWLSNDYMNKLKLKTKLLKLDISNLGISMQEFLNPEVIEDLKFKIDVSPFNTIRNTLDDIYIICSKNTKDNSKKQIEKLEEELSKIGLRIKKYYHISETFYNSNDDDKAFLKAKLVLQHLLGLKTSGDKFINEELEDYNQITFWDDNSKSIKMVKNINLILEKLLLKTEESEKLKIKDKIKSDDNFILIKEWTHNKANKFIETSTQLELSNVIKSFEGFIWMGN